MESLVLQGFRPDLCGLGIISDFKIDPGFKAGFKADFEVDVEVEVFVDVEVVKRGQPASGR